MYNKMNAIIKGHDCRGKEFEVTLEFTLIPPKDSESYYGNGHYMTVEQLCDRGAEFIEYVDVRYECTTDIEILADRFIKRFFGKNAEDVWKQFPN